MVEVRVGVEPSRIFSTGRSKIRRIEALARRPGPARRSPRPPPRGRPRAPPPRPRAAPARLARREAALELRAGPGESPREPAVGVAAHPAEDLDGGPDGAERSSATRAVRSRGERARRGAPAAALSRATGRRGASRSGRAPSPPLAGLVAPDRDVLRAVVATSAPAAERERRGTSEAIGPRLARPVGEGRAARRCSARRATATAARPTGARTQARLGQPRGDRGSTAKASARRNGPRTNGTSTRAPSQGFGRTRRDRAVGQAHGAPPGRRPVDEHAVLEGHAAEAKLLHAQRVASAGGRAARPLVELRRPTGAGRPRVRHARRRRPASPRGPRRM